MMAVEIEQTCELLKMTLARTKNLYTAQNLSTDALGFKMRVKLSLHKVVNSIFNECLSPTPSPSSPSQSILATIQNSICNNEIVYMESQIVDGFLVKNSLKHNALNSFTARRNKVSYEKMAVSQPNIINVVEELEEGGLKKRLKRCNDREIEAEEREEDKNEHVSINNTTEPDIRLQENGSQVIGINETQGSVKKRNSIMPFSECLMQILHYYKPDVNNSCRDAGL